VMGLESFWGVLNAGERFECLAQVGRHHPHERTRSQERGCLSEGRVTAPDDETGPSFEINKDWKKIHSAFRFSVENVTI